MYGTLLSGQRSDNQGVVFGYLRHPDPFAILERLLGTDGVQLQKAFLYYQGDLALPPWGMET